MIIQYNVIFWYIFNARTFDNVHKCVLFAREAIVNFCLYNQV